jgi:hypothetical protein
MSTWEIALMQVTPNLAVRGQARLTKYRTTLFGLLNGGTAGLIWGYLLVWMGYMLVFASIAEMASMYLPSLPARRHRF